MKVIPIEDFMNGVLILAIVVLSVITFTIY